MGANVCLKFPYLSLWWRPEQLSLSWDIQSLVKFRNWVSISRTTQFFEYAWEKKQGKKEKHPLPMLLLFFVASCIASFLQKKCFFSGKEAFVFSILRPPGRNSNCAPRPILAVSFSLLFGHEGRAKPPSRTYTKTLRAPQSTNCFRRNPILLQIGRITDSGRKGLFWPFWRWIFPHQTHVSKTAIISSFSGRKIKIKRI